MDNKTYLFTIAPFPEDGYINMYGVDITERKQADETLQQLVRDLLFISHSAMDLVELPREKNIYQLIGEQLEQITPPSAILAVCEFDETANTFLPQSIMGLDKIVGTITKILGRNPMQIRGDFGPEARQAVSTGKLHKIRAGLQDFAHLFPESILKPVAKLIGVTAFYVVGFVKEGKILGGLCIFLRGESSIANPSVLETLAAQAAMAIARRKAETALGENEMRYRMVFDHAKDGIALADAKTGLLVDCNQALCDMVEKERSEIIGKPQSALHPPQELKNGFTPGFAESDAATAELTHQDRLFSKSGKEIPVEISAGSAEIEGRRYLLGVFRDITDRKQAEEALRKSEEKYRSLVDSANEGILVAQDGMLKFVNQRAAEFSGHSEPELMSKPFPEFVYPDDRAMVLDYYMKRMKGDPAPMNYEFRLLSADGSAKWVAINTIRIDWNGKPAALSFLTDIAERKHLENEKEKLLSQLLQAQKMEAIGTLAGGVAHDFNNLLSAISGYTSLAMAKVPESDPVHRDLAQVSNAATRAAGVVRQLLLFSRKHPMELAPVNLNNAVKSLAKMLERVIGEDIAIELDLGQEPWPIRGDEGSIEQVLMNLAVNARDAMQSGGTLSIKTKNVATDQEYCRAHSAGRPGRFVCLSIADTGTGMDELVQEHIFEPFFTTKAAGKGTGLGLSVVLGIVQQHQGWIEVQSEPGKGSTFMVYFPCSSVKTEQKSMEPVPLSSLRGNGERILLVEDHQEVRFLTNEILSTNGYAVFAASCAKDALAAFEKDNGGFDLVLTDVGLPDKSGVWLVEELLKRAKMQVLFCSGYTDEKSNWDYIRNKNFRFLRKPFSIPDLLAAVKEVLAGKKS
ncbi:MAG TPA: PAS domain S-box protein [Chitinivibrionales bacterium]|nr:PAS domain S-box protein [Chitinivibrionales bacterium]